MTIPEQFYHYWFTQNSTPQDNYDYDGAGNLIYQGMAQVGIDPAAQGWVITKYIYDGSNRMIHDSTLVNKTWSLRTTYTFP